MPGSLKVLACVDYDVATETCATEAYIDPPTIIPTMTAEQGASIGFKLFAAVVMVRVVVMIREAWADRIG